MAKGRKENLVSLADRTTEEQREIAVAGGKASGIARKKKKLIKDTIEEFLQAVNPETGNNFQIDVVAAMFQKALEGDVSAFNSLRDTAGQKPKEDVAVVNMPIINIKGL